MAKSFKNKSRCILQMHDWCHCCQDVSKIQIFHSKRIEWPSSFGWIQSNSKLVSAKQWTYQTPNEWTNASVMILLIEKYKLLNQAYLACRHCWCQIVRKFFLLQEKGMMVKLPMGIINSNPKQPLKVTSAIFDTKQMSKYLRCDFVEWK